MSPPKTKTSPPARIDSGRSGFVVASLRLTVFYMDSREPVAFYKEATNTEPDEQRTQPRIKIIVEDGRWAGGKLTTSATDVRRDMVHAACPGPDDAEYVWSLGTMDEAMSKFFEVIEGTINDPRPIRRIALGAYFEKPTEGRISGYQMLGELLHHVEVDPEGSRDFSYRINRPRKLELDGKTAILINRLTSWMVAERSAFRLEVSGGEGLPVPHAGTSEWVVRVETDVNTDADFAGPIPRERIRGIVDLLAQNAKELSEKGDIS